MMKASAFKTAAGESEYLAAYETVLGLWPVPYEEVGIESRFGTTHVVISGEEDAPPLVLLHGFMNTLMIWLPNVADLSRDYRVYAIDTMGHPSKSVPDEPIRDATEVVEWLTATLDGLNLDRVFLAGISHGGWIALAAAIAASERVGKLVLLSPAASFLPLRRQFLMRTMLSLLPPRRHRFESMMSWMGLEETPGDPLAGPLLNLIWLGGNHFRMPPETRRVTGSVFSDDELKSLSVPVLLLMGEKEVIYDSAKALDRAKRLIPELEGSLVPRSSHAMSFNQAQIVNARMLGFLEAE